MGKQQMVGKLSGDAGRGPTQPGRVKPNMHAMYGVVPAATRPIPVIRDYGDMLAIKAAAANAKPKMYAVNMPSSPHPAGLAPVLGTPVAGATKVVAGVYNPATGLGEHT